MSWSIYLINVTNLTVEQQKTGQVWTKTDKDVIKPSHSLCEQKTPGQGWTQKKRKPGPPKRCNIFITGKW